MIAVQPSAVACDVKVNLGLTLFVFSWLHLFVVGASRMQEKRLSYCADDVLETVNPEARLDWQRLDLTLSMSGRGGGRRRRLHWQRS